MASGGKRQRDSAYADGNGRNKRRGQFGGEREQGPLPTPDDTTYRILCPGSKIGGVIGRGGNIIKSLRYQTHARIKITDAVPGVEERVILIWSTPQDRERGKYKDASHEERTTDTEKDDDFKGKEEEQGGAAEPEFLCPAQEALFRVHACIVEEDKEVEEEKEEEKEKEEEENVSDYEEKDAPSKAPAVTARILVPNNQIGCLLGKGGKIIQQMRTETGAQIRILPKDQLPGCALPSDELVQISGDPATVKKGMFEISARIHENPPRDRPQGASAFLPPGPRVPLTAPNLLPPGNPLPHMNSFVGSENMGGPPFGFVPPPGFGGFGNFEPRQGFGGHEPYGWPAGSPAVSIPPPLSAPPGESKGLLTEQEYILRLLCPDSKIGPIIGKGGSSIRQICSSTGARIRVEESVPGSDERVITISATEFLHDGMSPVIEAALQLQGRTGGAIGEREGTTVTRLLVPSKQIGCLLGKKGVIIAEMRKRTSATIKILKKVDLPKCAKDTDELVQVIAEPNVAREALLEILTRLRNDVFKDQLENRGRFGGGPGPIPSVPLSHPLHMGIPTNPVSKGGRHEPGSPDRMYMNGLGMQGSGRFSENYGSIGQKTPGSDYGSASNYGGGLYSGYQTGRGGSDFSDTLPKGISGTPVELTIPGSAVSAVLGEGGINISKICQISGAKLKVHDPRPGSRDRAVEISGTPEQTLSAKSLLQGFILSSQTPAGTGTRGQSGQRHQ